MLIPFDILYEGFCNRVRSSGKSDTILQLVKKENNEKLRIQALLAEEPDLYSLLQRNVSDSFEKKDEIKARKFWERGKEGKSLELLTEAIAYCPLPESFEETVLRPFEPDNQNSLLKKFMECPLKENLSDGDTSKNLIGLMFYDRSNILFRRKQYKNAFRDLIRAWLLGLAKSLEMTYEAAVCLFENGNLDESKELLQCAAQHLRAISMSNEGKSEWTMSIVKVLKAIEGIRKLGSKTKQERSCILSKAKENEELTIFSTLFSGESEKIKGTSDKVELKHSPEKGRHMVAKANIPPGSTIIAEMPYAWAISKPKYYRFCTWCLQRVHDGVPCSSCASVIFCDAHCQKHAMDAFHGKECRVLKLVDASQKLGNMALLCYRTLLITPINIVHEYTKFFDDEASVPPNALMGLNDEDKLDSSSYLSVFSQTPNSDQRNAADLLKRTLSAIYLTLCLKHIGYFNEDSGESHPILCGMSNLELGVAALFLRHLQGASCNAYGINHIEKKSNYLTEEEDYQKNLEIDEIGGATYPVISTTNHSCNPNAYRINTPGRVCLLKALREIPEGEEILDCYGPLYLTEARQERISKLQTQYLFRCNCSPCAENWPTYGNLRKTPTRFKCSSCGCALKVEGKNAANGKVKCPYCDKVTDMKKLMNGLTTLKERFSMAKTSILGEAFQPFDKDMEAIITEYIKMCQVAYLEPNIESVEAQEYLKLFWNISIRNS